MLLKRTVAFLLVLVFFAQTFSRYLLVADYYIDTAAYIARCVNKDKPMMHCNGRCQLCKKMQQQDKSDKQSPERRTAGERFGPLASGSSFTGVVPLWPTCLKLARRPEMAGGKILRMPRGYFHPPDLSLV